MIIGVHRLQQMIKSIDIVKLVGRTGQRNILNERKTLKVIIRKKNGNKKRKSTKRALGVKDLGKKYVKILQKVKRDIQLLKIT